MPGDTWTRCTRPSCGDYVLLADVDEHLDMHAAVALAEEQDRNPPPTPPRPQPRSPKREPKPGDMSQEPTKETPRRLEKRSSKSKSDGTGLLNWLAGTPNHNRSIGSTVHRIRAPKDPGRLGKRELGPYAFEDRMPEDVRAHLSHAAEPQTIQRIARDGNLIRERYIPNETAGLIRVIADLCAVDEETRNTYLCHTSVRHVRKLNCDGNFCGYWNIQVMLTYIQHMNPRGPQRIPNVLEIQDLIERAWDDGICAYSRIETGGIRNTRKWIGTQEALAFFQRINVKAEALSVEDGEKGSEKYAVEELLDYVEAYFVSGTDTADIHGTSFTTQLAPIYFQRFGHSMTIVGLEKRADGTRNLLVFDSSFATADPMKRLVAGATTATSIDTLLRTYRKSDLSLRRWDAFEMIM